MKCPACQSSRIQTTTTRQADAASVLRMRKCNICNHPWLTQELIVPGCVNWRQFPPSIELDP
jgi:transcriptional regulator NrdR family protein